MRTLRTYILAVLVAGFLLASPASSTASQILLNPTALGGAALFAFDPLGQSFTAEDPSVTAALYFFTQSTSSPNTDPVRYDLFAGNGTGGALLASSTFNLPTGFEGFRDVDFSSVTLTVGNLYSLTASVVGGSGYWSLRPTADVYPFGQLIGNGVPLPGDYALRVMPTPAAAVPEPGSLLLIGSGFGLLAARRRVSRRRSTGV